MHIPNPVLNNIRVDSIDIVTDEVLYF